MNDIHEIANQFNIELDENRANELAAKSVEFQEQIDEFDASDPEDDFVESYVPGDDKYNAFRYQFNLSGGQGNLEGIEVAIKDNIAVAGVPMHCGSESFNFKAPYNATAVSNLLEHGASVVGTTNMDKLAYFTTGETCEFGDVLNPRDEGRVAGGSSAGSGAAVAAGLVDAALGTDTGGSVRIPASFTGVVGFKPTYKSISRFGFVDLAPSLDHIGALGNSVETTAKVIDSMVGTDINDPSTYPGSSPENISSLVEEEIKDLKIGLIEEAFEISNDAVEKSVLNKSKDLKKLGTSVETVSLPGFSDIIYAMTTIESCEFASLLMNNGLVYGEGTGYSEAMRKEIHEFMTRGNYGDHLESSLIINSHLLETTGGKQYIAAQNARRDFTDNVNELFDTYDALITPTTPMPAPEPGEITTLDDLLETEANTAPFNLTGHPAITVPVIKSDELPVGLQIIAGYNEDDLTAQVASAVEAIQ